jgi:small subunit ribosomal protein S1
MEEPPETGSEKAEQETASAVSAPAIESPADPPAAPPPAEAESEAGTPQAETGAAPQARAAEDSMAAAVVSKPQPIVPKKGSRISGKIVRIGEDGAFVDFGGREEGFLDARELRDEKGELTKQVGEKIQATVVSVEGGVKLSTKGGRRSGNVQAVLEAQKGNLPVEGKITGVNKGGLVVHVMGVRAFCPFSQIDRHYVDDPTTYVGKKFTFRVASADERGKNVVLSRRALLEEGVRERAGELRKQLQVGQDHTGVVARIRPFGAFVDLGGVDGLVHVSEITHGRVKDPSEVLQVGQSVKVRILKIEDLGGKGERVSLSIKRLLDDPWDVATRELRAGEKVQGEIVRIVDFGAFVCIAPGVDGLIHVSALATQRVKHPADVVSVGQKVEAWILSVDSETRRVSLSLVDPAERAERQPPRQRGGRGGGGRRREGREAPEPRQEQRKDTGMTSMEEAFQRMKGGRG